VQRGGDARVGGARVKVDPTGGVPVEWRLLGGVLDIHSVGQLSTAIHHEPGRPEGAICSSRLLVHPTVSSMRQDMALIISLPDSNGIRYPICRTSDCGMSESPREEWTRVQGMSPPYIRSD
jgi:hypothetical protein